MFREPVHKASPADWPKSNGGGAASLAESLGKTRFFGQTYVVGGNAYASLAAAVVQGRHLQFEAAGL
jgi:hypothetical protein